MKLFFNLLFASVLFFSCNDNDDIKHKTSCGDGTYIEDQEWFKNIMEECTIQAVCTLSIHKGLYKGDTVYLTGLNGPLCDPAFYIVLLDCQGDTLKEYNWDNKDEYETEFTYIGMVAECSGD